MFFSEFHQEFDDYSTFRSFDNFYRRQRARQGKTKTNVTLSVWIVRRSTGYWSTSSTSRQNNQSAVISSTDRCRNPVRVLFGQKTYRARVWFSGRIRNPSRFRSAVLGSRERCRANFSAGEGDIRKICIKYNLRQIETLSFFFRTFNETLWYIRTKKITTAVSTRSRSAQGERFVFCTIFHDILRLKANGFLPCHECLRSYTVIGYVMDMTSLYTKTKSTISTSMSKCHLSLNLW